ncbi:MAG TPA: hypothetical protein VF510_25585 [Ktedonobacterales bacterium]
MPFRSTLTQWDNPSWHTERNYSASVASAFKDIHRLLAPSAKELSAYLRAHDALLRLVHTPMSAHQREHLFYLLGMGDAAGGRYKDAHSSLDQALNLALTLNEPGDACQLLIFRASVFRGLLKVGEAAADLRTCLSTWGKYAEDTGKALSDVIDPAVRLEVYARLAGDAFYQADYAGAQEAVDQGRALLRLVRSHALEKATLDWTQSLLCSVGKKPDYALELALHANEGYARQSAPSRIRSHVLVAGAALDRAESMTDRTRSRALIQKQALPYLDSAKRLAHIVDDNAGLGLTILLGARASRLLGYDEIRERQIEPVIHLARRLDDETLLAQAHTALGDEYASQGKFSRALSAYRDALGVLDGSEALALKNPARIRIREIEMDGSRRD